MDVAPTKNNESVEISYYVSSDVSGALLNVVLLNGSSDIQSSFIMPLDRNTPLPSNWHPGHYKIYVYDIGSNGTLNNGVGYPAAFTNATFGDPEDTVQSNYNAIIAPIAFQEFLFPIQAKNNPVT